MKKSTIYPKCCIDTGFGVIIPLGRNEDGLIYCKEVSISPNGNDVTYPIYSLSKLQELAHTFDGDDYSFTWSGAFSDSSNYGAFLRFNYDELMWIYALSHDFLNGRDPAEFPEVSSVNKHVSASLTALESRMKKDGFPIE